MNKSIKTANVEKQTLPPTPDDSFNGNYTAQPKSLAHDEHLATDPNFIEESPEYGEMNLRDAQLSGDTDKEGKAISRAKKDIDGHPTGAYTDIGHGRSSVVSTADDDRAREDRTDYDQRH